MSSAKNIGKGSLTGYKYISLPSLNYVRQKIFFYFIFQLLPCML